MKLTPRRLAESEEDIFEIARYFDDHSDSAADRFFDAVRKTTTMLCENPELGEIFYSDPGRSIRYRTIMDFHNYVIFYQHTETELLLVRVTHGGRDFADLFL